MKVIESPQFKQVLNNVLAVKEEYINDVRNINMLYEKPYLNLVQTFKNKRYALLFIVILFFIVASLGYLYMKDAYLIVLIPLTGILVWIIFQIIAIRKANIFKEDTKREWDSQIKQVEAKKDRFEQEKRMIKENVIESIFLTEKNEELAKLKTEMSAERYQAEYQAIKDAYADDITKALGLEPTAKDLLEYYLNWRQIIAPNEYEDIKQNRYQYHERKANFLNIDKEVE